MSTWRERVETERNELDEKLKALTNFLNVYEAEQKVGPYQYSLLSQQRKVMNEYRNILDMRLGGTLDGNE
jgi:hypothetical protein